MNKTIKMIKIYTLKDPITNEVRYVGKTYRDENVRLREHIYDSKRKKGYKENWIKKIISEGNKPIIEVIDIVPEEEWQQWEIFYISKFNLKQDKGLVNIELGGNGSGRVHETTKKILQDKNKTKKSIKVFKLTGEVCGIFKSISECVRDFFLLDRNVCPKDFKRIHSSISRICAGKNKSYLGYVFCYFEGLIDNSKNQKFDKEYSKTSKKRQKELTMKGAKEIRDLYVSGLYTQRELSRKFSVNVAIINFVLNNKSFVDASYKADIENIKNKVNCQDRKSVV